jgi:hypothetical protein
MFYLSYITHRSLPTELPTTLHFTPAPVILQLPSEPILAEEMSLVRIRFERQIRHRYKHAP